MGYYDSYHRRKQQSEQAKQEADDRLEAIQKQQMTQMGLDLGLRATGALFNARAQNIAESKATLGEQVGSLTGEDYKNIPAGTSLYSEKDGTKAWLTGNRVEGFNPEVTNALTGDQMKGKSFSEQQAILEGDLTELYGSNAAEAYMSGGENKPGLKALAQRIMPGGESGKTDAWSPESTVFTDSFSTSGKDSGGVGVQYRDSGNEPGIGISSPDFIDEGSIPEYKDTLEMQLARQAGFDAQDKKIASDKEFATTKSAAQAEIDQLNAESAAIQARDASDEIIINDLNKRQDALVTAENEATAFSRYMEDNKAVSEGFMDPVTVEGTIGESAKDYVETDASKLTQDQIAARYERVKNESMMQDPIKVTAPKIETDLVPEAPIEVRPETNVEDVSKNIMKNTQESFLKKSLDTQKDISAGISAVKGAKTLFSEDATDDAKLKAGADIGAATSKFLEKKLIKESKKKIADEANKKIKEEALKQAGKTGLGTAAKGIGGAAAAVTGFYAASEGVKGFEDAKERGDTDEMIAQGVTATGGAVAGVGGVLTGLGALATATGVGAVIGAPMMAIGSAMTTYGGIAATAGSMYTMAENALEKKPGNSVSEENNFTASRASLGRNLGRGQSLGRSLGRA